MKKVKLKIFTRVFLLIIISFSVIGIVFNVAVNKYMNKKAVEQINVQIKEIEKEYSNLYAQYLAMEGTYIFFESDSYDIHNTDDQTINYYDMYNIADQVINYYEPAETSVISINRITVDSYYTIYDLKYYENLTDMQNIVKYYSNKRFSLEEGKCIKLKVNDKEYYTAGKTVILGYNGKRENASGIDDDVTWGTVILAADVKPLTDFVERINVIFLIIVSAAGFIICVAGYKIGINIEKDRQNLKFLFQNVSHELKTPIMSIQGYAEGIETDVMKDHARAAEVILNESENMRGLIEEILFISKIDNGRLKKVREELNICELLYYCMGRIEQEAAKKNITLEADFAKDIPMYKGDEVQLEKVFSNLLSNALRYAKTKIKISCTLEKKYIKIVVADDGNGIDEKDFPHIFERFYKGKYGNTGIGLSIAKEVVKMHKGKMEAKNDNGANFIVRLKV